MAQLRSHSIDVDRAVDQLTVPPETSRTVSVADRIRLCQQCLPGVMGTAEEWAAAAAAAKGAAADAGVMAEDLLSGPGVVARQLQLMMQTLKSIATRGRPTLPGKVRRLPNGQRAVPVFPTKGFFDSLTFSGLSGSVRMQPGVEESDIHGTMVDQAASGEITGLSAILGAGNVSSIPATDSLHKIMFEGRAVVLKMNPVNEYLAPIFERAFAPLIHANLLRIITGGADTGHELIHHTAIHDVHITGSSATHDAIVWGSDPSQQQTRKQAHDPLLAKPVTSELGNVTPWIIVPGAYSSGQLKSQAQHVAASITNNVSFNCLATKVILTWSKWSQREQFLDLVKKFLSATPRRTAYYPGAVERFRRFTGTDASPDESNRLPWTLLTGQSFSERPELFTEESFVCVCAETALEAATAEAFVGAATEFVNEQMFGSLCASVTMPAGFRRRHPAVVDRCLELLRYGSVCLNQWSGLAYGLVSPPWGAYPGGTLQQIDSGIGSVHNTYLLGPFEKTILEGPLVNFPRPVWFPSHKKALNVGRSLLSLYNQPSLLRLPRLFASALTG